MTYVENTTYDLDLSDHTVPCAVVAKIASCFVLLASCQYFKYSDILLVIVFLDLFKMECFTDIEFESQSLFQYF